MRLILLDHNFGGLDDRSDRIAFCELKLVGAPSRDRTFNEVVAYTDDHVSHDIPQLNLFDFSAQSVSG